MKKLLFIIAIFCTLKGYSQPELVTSASQSAAGSIVFPALQSLKVELLNNEPIHFSDPTDYTNGKVVPNFCRITVISNVPWVVMVKPASNDLFPSQQSSPENIPASIFEFKSKTGSFLKLSNNERPILISNNNKVLNVYDLDLRANPSWNYGGGTYNLNVVFTLTPQ